MKGFEKVKISPKYLVVGIDREYLGQRFLDRYWI